MATAPISQEGYTPASSDDGESLSSAAGGIVMRLLDLAQEQVRQRRQIELRWLEDLRAYHGRYDEVTETNMSDKKRSRAFVNIPRSKTNAWNARLGDLLFPADGKNWGIQPTPVPELDEEAKEAVEKAERQHAAAQAKTEQANALNDEDPLQAAQKEALLAEVDEHGTLAVEADQVADRLNKELDEAKKRAAAMEKEIEDQLVECRFPQRARDIIDDAVKLGVGVVKGPFVSNRPRRTWVKDAALNNVYHLGGAPGIGHNSRPTPAARRVDPWSFFPQMNAQDMADAEFAFERHLPNAAGLRKLAKALDFDQEATRNLLKEGPGSSSTDLNHLAQLRGITGEGESVIDRYVVWEYHGPLEPGEIATLLRAMGGEENIAAAEAVEMEADVLTEHMVVAYFSGTRLLKISPEYLMDSGESLYSVFSFEKGEASIMGAIGIPRIVYDAVSVLNAAWRMMVDNAGLSVGPQIVADKTLIQPQNGDWNLTPLKLWWKVGQEVAGTSSKAFEMFNVPMNQAQLAGIIEMALKFIDEEAALPMLSQGEQGTASPTLGGMAMLFNAASVVFRRVVRNWDDDLTEPLIRRFYDWNMQFSDKEHIKGDLQVKAQGTGVLLVREMMAMQLAGIVQTWTTHPVLAAFLKNNGFEAAQQFLKSLSLPSDMILDQWPAIEQRLKDAAASAQQSPEAIRAQSSIQVATISAESRAMEGANQLEIAGIQREIELIKLAEQSEMTLEELNTRLQLKDIETKSKERIFAGELGFEAQNAADARARGEKPDGSGGYVSAGDGV